MTVDIIGISILLGIFALLLIIKLPIAFCLAISSMATAVYEGISLGTVTQRMVAGVDSFSLLAIPFFILAGEIMGAGGITDRLVKLSDVIVGRVRGGLACVNVLNSTFFGAIQGSIVADIASLGPIQMRMMRKAGYPDSFSIGVTIASSGQSVILPPGHNMIIYASAVGGISIGKLFMAGMIPGLVLGAVLMIQVFIISWMRGYPKGQTYPFKESIKIILDSFAGLFTVVLIVGGVLSGIVTANESAVIACIWAFFITLVLYKGITVKEVWTILKRVLGTLAMVFTMIAAASAFGYMMTILRIPSLTAQWFLSISDNKYVLLFLINVMLLLIGTIIDGAPLILICAPVLYPVITGPNVGMDPIHFGVVMMLNLAIGLMTPPIGTALFVGAGISGLKMEQIVKAMLPFYATMILTLFLLTYIPALSMTIPNMMFGD